MKKKKRTFKDVRYKNLHKKYHVNKVCKTSMNSKSWFDIDFFTDGITRAIPRVHDYTDKITTRARKIRVVFTKKQRNKIKQWLSLVRRTYNIAAKLAVKNKLSVFKKLRAMVKPIYKQLYGRQIKSCGIPIHTLDNAVKDVCLAYKTSWANYKAGNIKKFKIRPLKKTKDNLSLVIEGGTFSNDKNSFAYNTMGEIKSTEPIMGLKKNARLKFNRIKNKFYLFLSENRIIKTKLTKNRECAMDPGIRTFQTVYDKDNYYNICTNVKSEMKPILDKIDAATRFRGTKWQAKYERRLYNKIQNKVRDLHWKSALFLCKRFDEITVGKLSTKSIISKKNNLSKLNKRLCQLLSHYTFRLRLKSKCDELGVKFNEIDESYTTKKCGGCGRLTDVGRSKTYTCQHCSFTLDRDFNGARNIMIKKDMKL